MFNKCLILLALAVIGSFAQNPTCSENEEWLTEGRECNCDNHCWFRSSPSCFCKEGFSKNINGDCIPQSECVNDIHCGENQLAVSCANACPPTCDNPDRFPCPDTPCEPGCVCNGDFVLKGNGSELICVPKEECPTKTTTIRPPDVINCRENEEYNSGKTECICGEHCYVPQSSACNCKEGFIKYNGTCISNEQCLRILNVDPECGPNEEQWPCEDPCPKTCGNPDNGPCYSYQCTPGCRCKPGTWFDENQRDCVPIGTCASPLTPPTEEPCTDESEIKPVEDEPEVVEEEPENRSLHQAKHHGHARVHPKARAHAHKSRHHSRQHSNKSHESKKRAHSRHHNQHKAHAKRSHEKAEHHE